MKLQVKQYGNSKMLVLPPAFLDYYELKVGDWIDMSDITKANKEVNK